MRKLRPYTVDHRALKPNNDNQIGVSTLKEIPLGLMGRLMEGPYDCIYAEYERLFAAGCYYIGPSRAG